MGGIVPAMGILEKFISLGKELAKLPAMVLPQYQAAATDLYRICKRILSANENMSRWLNRFLYFNFAAPTARGDFMTAMQEYQTMKNGPEYQQLKFSCHDISRIYDANIRGKLGNWFTGQVKKDEAEGIFNNIANSDLDMVSYMDNLFLGQLDTYLGNVETAVNAGNMDEAEKQRLEFKNNFREESRLLNQFSSDLSGLVIEFANIARVPLTLGPD